MELIDQYQKELEEDIKLDQINLTEVAYCIPSIKHKWVARLINTKIRLNKLENLKKEVKDNILSQLKENNNKQTFLSLERTLDTNDIYKNKCKKIDEEIENLKLIILYLEKLDNIFKNLTYDIKNIIDLNKLETT
jgi:hypothetical protein